MGRRSRPVGTQLGKAVRDKRAGRRLVDVAPLIGVSHTTLSTTELGTYTPSIQTARALAAWLGWSMEEVLDAAEHPAGPTEPVTPE